ncbi:hypothetical protein ACJ41O_009398 [Fusarium nematophilum]
MSPEPADKPAGTAKATRPRRVPHNAYETIRKQEQRAVGCISFKEEDHPELYKDVVKQLKDSGIGRHLHLSDSHLCKSFLGWVQASDDDSRPNLRFFLAALAAHDCLATIDNTTFNKAVHRRGLREWAMKQLANARSCTKSTTQTTATSTTTTSPREGIKKALKVEEVDGPGLDVATRSAVLWRINEQDNNHHSIRQSIETGFHDARTTGSRFEPRGSPFETFSKRRADDQLPPEHSHKRVKTDMDHEAFAARIEMLEAQNRKVTLRDTGTQTDSDMLAEWAVGLATKHTMPMVTDAAEEARTLVESLSARFCEGLQRMVMAPQAPVRVYPRYEESRGGGGIHVLDAFNDPFTDPQRHWRDLNPFSELGGARYRR